MGTSGGPLVYDSASAKKNLRSDGYVALRSSATGKVEVGSIYADITTDADQAWFLIFTAFPRDTSPYNANDVSSPPDPNDTTMSKFSDSVIQGILNRGLKQTRTQWYHTSVEFGTVWADGSLNNRSTQYNEFENPSNWNSTGGSSGERFKRKWGGASWTDWITSAGSTCSGAVGGWSNYYEQSCVQSWFAGCEGGPAINHRCAGGIQDRANKLIIWAN
jgi:hypothetical protein